VGVTYCDSQCIGGMVGRRDFLEVQKQPNHPLDLNFISSSVSDDSAFDFQRGIFKYR
jgi:hypothetical protein